MERIDIIYDVKTKEEKVNKQTLTEDEVAKIEKSLQDTRLSKLRQQREVECFPIINRGQLWYDTLTDEQKTELKEWYVAWLNLPNNYPTNDTIPQKPSWIN